MKNINKTVVIVLSLIGALSSAEAQTDKMQKQPQHAPQPIEDNKKVIRHEDDQLNELEIQKSDEQVYTEVDEMPQFKGGNEALYKWIGETIKYPEVARKNKKEGIVTAQFIIEKDGKVSNAKIVKDEVGFEADKEVLQLLAKMPYWSAGKVKDKPVRVLYTIPVSFKL